MLALLNNIIVTINSIFQNNYFRYKQKIEELRKQMNWDQQELETWLEQTAKKDDDVLTVQKYAQADQTKIKVITLRGSEG